MLMILTLEFVQVHYFILLITDVTLLSYLHFVGT